MPRTRVAALAAAVAALAAGCGGTSAPSSTPPGLRTPPSIAAFLQLPVATPSACPSTVSGSSVGRSSPWVGHVDVSVFINPSTDPAMVRRLGTTLRGAAIVEKAYFETKAQAYAEFQRLYTCWTQVPPSQTPASYRLVLTPTSTIGQRNALVTRMLRDPAVDTASCDPSVPCTDLVASASPHE